MIESLILAFATLISGSCEPYFLYSEYEINEIVFEVKNSSIILASENLLTNDQIDSLTHQRLESFLLTSTFNVETEEFQIERDNDYSELASLVSGVENLLKGFIEIWGFLSMNDKGLEQLKNTTLTAETGEIFEFNSNCSINNITTEAGIIEPVFVVTNGKKLLKELKVTDSGITVLSTIEYIIAKDIYLPKLVTMKTITDEFEFETDFLFQNFKLN